MDLVKWHDAAKDHPEPRQLVVIWRQYELQLEMQTGFISLGFWDGSRVNSWRDKVMNCYCDDVSHWHPLLSPPEGER